MALGGKRALATPLTRSTRAGKPYTRPPDIEAQLNELLREDAAEQLARAERANKAAPEYVKDECLVYLIREAALSEDAQRYNALVAQLLRRCSRSIKRNLVTLGVAADDVQDVHADVITAMMEAILAEEGRGEFYQVRFRRALRLQILKVHERYDRQRQHAQLEDSLSAPLARGNEAEGEGHALEELVGGPEDITERRALITEALSAIRDPRHREAFVLHHYDGWPIETKDPLDPSISRRFGVMPRTVSNWLRAAESDLAAWSATKTPSTGESQT